MRDWPHPYDPDVPTRRLFLASWQFWAGFLTVVLLCGVVVVVMAGG